MTTYAPLRVLDDGWNGQRRLCLVGEIDLQTAPDLRTALHEEIAAAAGEVVVLDCVGMDFIDSTGRGVLVGALKIARHGGGDLRDVDGAPRRTV